MSFGEAEREYFGVYDAFAAGDRERATRRCPRIVSNQNPSPTQKERLAASAVAAIGTQRAARSRWSTSSSVDGSGDERRLDLHHRAATLPHSSPPSRSPLSLSLPLRSNTHLGGLGLQGLAGSLASALLGDLGL